MPDPNPTPNPVLPAGGNPPPVTLDSPTEPPQNLPTGLDLSAEVVLGDGTKTTVGNLVAAQTQGAALQEQVTALTEYRDASRTLMNPEASEAEKRAAAALVWRAEGLNDEQIAAQMAAAFHPASTPTSKPGGENVPSEDPTDSNPTSAELAAQQASQNTSNLFRQMMERDIATHIETALDTEGLLGKIVRAVRSRAVAGGDAAAAQATVDLLKQRIRKGTIEQLSTRLKAGGGTGLDLSWVPEAVNAAAKDIADFRAALADVNPLGSVPETVSEVEELLKTEPLKRPDPLDSKLTQGQKLRAGVQALESEFTHTVAEDVRDQRAGSKA